MIQCSAGCLSLIHISEPTRLGMISYAVFCLKKKSIKRSTVVRPVRQTCSTVADRVCCEKHSAAWSVTAGVVNTGVAVISDRHGQNFDAKYPENGDRYEVGPRRGLDRRTHGLSIGTVRLTLDDLVWSKSTPKCEKRW